MTDVVMLQAALFQIRAATEQVDSDAAPQLGLCINVLASAVTAAAHGVTTSTISDVRFAANDLKAAIDELSQASADALSPLLATFLADLETLESAVALDPAVVAQIRTFQAKLRERMKAIERQTFLEQVTEPLPHPPEVLRNEAVAIGRELLAAGFATPGLDTLIAEPESVRLHSLRDIVEELDVIVG